jgi:hypothetical protein
MPVTKNSAVRRNIKKAQGPNNMTALTDISTSAAANKVSTKVPETVKNNKVVMTVTNTKVSETVKIDMPTESLSTSSSGAATPESLASSTVIPCAGGQAALVPSDSDNTPSHAAQAIRKQIEKSRASHIVGAVTAPRKTKRTKKGRVPLTAIAKTNHNEFKTPGQECDKLLAKFAKQKRASRSVSPDTSVWKETNLFFTGLPTPVKDIESAEDEDMLDVSGLVSDDISDDFDNLAEELFMHAPASPASANENAFAASEGDSIMVASFDMQEATDQSFNDSVSDIPSLIVDGESSFVEEYVHTSLMAEEFITHLPDIADTAEILDDGDTLLSEPYKTSEDAAPFQDSDEDSEQSAPDLIQVTSPEQPNTEQSLNFLSFPNKAEYASVLSRNEELALIVQLVAADDVPVVNDQDTVVPDETSLLTPEVIPTEVVSFQFVAVPVSAKWLVLTPERVKDTLVVATPENADPEEPIWAFADFATANDEEPEDALLPAPELVDPAKDSLRSDNVLVAAEGETPVSIEVIEDTFVSGLLSLPNGCGQDAVGRQQEADLVDLYVRSHMKPPKQGKHSQKSKKAKKGVKKPIIIAEAKSIDGSNVSSSADEDTSLVISLNSRGSSCRSSSLSGHRSEDDLERDLIVARSTFLGVTSLEDFMVQLAQKRAGKTTTKKAVCNSFATLAAEEFEILTGLTLDTTDVDHAAISTLAQRKIKLGKTTLFSFLRGMSFDDENVTHTRDVMRAFREAAMVSDKPSEKVMMVLRAASESSS